MEVIWARKNSINHHRVKFVILASKSIQSNIKHLNVLKLCNEVVI
jgi:hypothetical protein